MLLNFTANINKCACKSPSNLRCFTKPNFKLPKPRPSAILLYYVFCFVFFRNAKFNFLFHQLLLVLKQQPFILGTCILQINPGIHKAADKQYNSNKTANKTIVNRISSRQHKTRNRMASRSSSKAQENKTQDKMTFSAEKIPLCTSMQKSPSAFTTSGGERALGDRPLKMTSVSEQAVLGMETTMTSPCYVH